MLEYNLSPVPAWTILIGKHLPNKICRRLPEPHLHYKRKTPALAGVKQTTMKQQS